MQRTFVRIVWCTLLLFPSSLSLHAEDFWQDTLWIRKIPLGGHSYAKILFHPDGKSLFAASDHYLFRYDVQTGNIISTFEMKEKGYIRDYEISRDRQNLILITDIRNNGNIPCFEEWNIETGYVRHYRYDNIKSDGQTASLAMCKNDSLLYVGCEINTGYLYIIDFKTGKYLETKKDVGKYLDITTDGKYMVSAFVNESSNGICKLIDMDTWETIAIFSKVYEPKFSRDDRFFAGRSESENIFLYDIENKKGYILKGHNGRISDIRFTNDSKYLVSSADDGGGGAKGGYYVWDAINRKKIYEAPYFTGTTGLLAVSTDNSYYATVGRGDGIFVSLWKFKGVVNSVLQNEEHSRTISIVPNPSSNTVTIQFPYIKEHASIIIRNISGKEIFKKYLTETNKIDGSIIVPTSDYPNGSYICTIIANNVPFLTTSFIINR